MFGKDSKFMKMTARIQEHSNHRRKSSEILNAAKSFYKPPPRPFPNRIETLNEYFANIYWSIRKLQFQLFFKNEGLLSLNKPTICNLIQVCNLIQFKRQSLFVILVLIRLFSQFIYFLHI
ncbi:hypothetical protein Mgra_00004890 [Meloidogyne graminicola]|uniref:Uncharacterized protein n=1 Tax=Meloidogyne graminicola TaxID=189291 RepID=A0A8S9ZRF9_9BILA|nr:hypothetical protein Mgra_00004890 [Meloidogyne graminicola]